MCYSRVLQLVFLISRGQGQAVYNIASFISLLWYLFLYRKEEMYHTVRKASLSWIVASCLICGFILQFLVAVDLTCASSHTTRQVNYQLEQEGCFIILIGKDRTTDGSVLVAHNEDGADKSTRLAYIPRQRHSEKEVHLNYVTMPQVPETLAYWAMGNSKAVAMKPEYDNEWILNGMNEAGVSVTCAVTSTRETAPPAKQGLTRFALRQLILERASSARAAVDLFSNLISEYGLALSPGRPDQAIAFGVADSKEAWLIESSFFRVSWPRERYPCRSITGINSGKNGTNLLAQTKLAAFQSTSNASSTSAPYHRIRLRCMGSLGPFFA